MFAGEEVSALPTDASSVAYWCKSMISAEVA
jgi:hypothetical protein